jgi:hypothetical protein
MLRCRPASRQAVAPAARPHPPGAPPPASGPPGRTQAPRIAAPISFRAGLPLAGAGVVSRPTTLPAVASPAPARCFSLAVLSAATAATTGQRAHCYRQISHRRSWCGNRTFCFTSCLTRANGPSHARRTSARRPNRLPGGARARSTRLIGCCTWSPDHGALRHRPPRSSVTQHLLGGYAALVRRPVRAASRFVLLDRTAAGACVGAQHRS